MFNISSSKYIPITLSSILLFILSIDIGIKVNYFSFIFFRIVHGTFSAAITYLLIKILKPTVYTLSNGVKFSSESFINSPTVAISLIIMGIVLIISLYTKKFAGNLREDIV